MADIRLHEPVIDALVTYLKANLPARVAAQRALAPAISATDMPDVADADYHFGEKQTFPTYPAIALIPAPSPISDDRKDRFDIDYGIAIGIFVTDGDEEQLTRKLLRYAAAVLEVIVDGRKAGAFAFTVDLEEQTLDPSPARAFDNSLFERDLFLSVECWKEEVR